MIVAVSKVSRPSARIICLDDQGRILLLRLRDPFAEETGLPGDLIEPRPVEIARAFRWNGRDHENTEWFYLARTSKTDLRPAGLLDDERDNYLGYRWFSLGQLQVSPERIEPIQLLEVIADLFRQ
jgi:hypothetical protein